MDGLNRGGLARCSQLPGLLQTGGFGAGRRLLTGLALLLGGGQFGFAGLGDGAIQAGGQRRCLRHQAAGTAQGFGGVI